MPGPPPPPPLPGMGAGRGGPPPPPMPPAAGRGGGKGGLPGQSQVKGAGRGALLSSIEGGARLKKVAVINDRSAPIVDNNKSVPAAPVGGAPPVPGMARRGPTPSTISNLALPSPSRARSNSDGGQDGAGVISGPPQLGGLFAGGIPKLRKTGGVDRGGDIKSPYLSDPETSRSSAPRPQISSTLKSPSGNTLGYPNILPPKVGEALPLAPSLSSPSVAQLRNSLRPASAASTISSVDGVHKPRPPPIGKKPPLPPPSSRKPSGLVPTPPTISTTPASPPPLPPSSAPRLPPLRSTPPPPPSNLPVAVNGGPSLAAQAARNAFDRNSGTSPAAPPPPPPPGSAPSPPSRKNDSDDEYDPYKYNSTPSRASPAPSLPPPRPSISAPPPPTTGPVSRQSKNPSVRSMLDVSNVNAGIRAPQQAMATAMGARPSPFANANASSYTLTNGTGSIATSAPQRGHIGNGGPVEIHDLRWKFQDDSSLPKPREWKGIQKRYRAGRVSSVPLDLSAFD